MAVKFSPWGNSQFVDATGAPASGYKIYTYAAGSSTLQTSYTSSDGLTAQSNPIVLNSLGLPTVGQIWLTVGQNYKLVWTDSNDVVKKTEDNISGVNDSSVTIDQWVSSGLTPTYVSASQFTLAGDQISAFTVGRRLKFTVTAGTVYGRISVSAYAALTTITVVMDGATVLDSGLSAVSYGLLTPTNNSFPSLIQAGSNITVTYDTSGRPVVTAAGGTVPRLLQNVGLAVTMAASAVTIALKDSAGADPSATSSANIGYRSATITSGASSVVSTTAALSTVISSGSTAGTTSAVASRIWVGAILVAGATELAWFNSGATGFAGAPIDEGALISTTAEGGAGAADSKATWYSTTARSNVPVTILGYFDSTQATAGTWATSASAIVVNPKKVPSIGVTVTPTVATTSGTSNDATGIPAGVTRVVISFVGVSTNGVSNQLVQLGSGSVQTSGYLGAMGPAYSTGGATNYTTGFGVEKSGGAATAMHGQMMLCLVDSATNTWTYTSNVGFSNAAETYVGGGSVSLSGGLDRVRLTTLGGADTFDAGLYGVQYE